MDESLKIRIVGAVVLLAVLAIAWPLLFDDAEEIRLAAESGIPQPPAVTEWQPAEHAPVDESRIGWPDKAEAVATTKTETETEAETEAAPASTDSGDTTTRAQPEASPQTLRQSWAVKVASLSDIENGKALVAKLIADDYRAYGRTSDTDSGPVMRVYIGPKFDKRRAASIKLEVDRKYAVKSMVVPYTVQ